MLRSSLIFLILFSLGAGAQTTSLTAQCKSDGHKTMLSAFELELTDLMAKILAERESGNAEFTGSLKSNAKAGSAKLVYTGFDHLFPEYEMTLTVPAKAFQEREFSVRLYGRGEALILEDYHCVVTN